MHVVCIGGQRLIDFWRRHFQNGGLVAILDVSDSEVCSQNRFRSVTWVCFGISNFMCMSFMGMGRKKSVDFQRRHSQNGRLVIILYFLAATKQLYKWYFPSVCPSVRLSVTAFWLCSHHRIIMKFSGVNTNDQRKVHAKGQGQRSKVKVTEVTTQLDRFRTVTPVWIHIWWWNDAYSLMLLRRGALLLFKVIRQISRSHSSKNRRIWPRLGVSGL